VLSFEKLTKENKEIIAEKLTFGDGCKELFEDIISMCEECGYTASVTSSLGSVVVLIYNGEGYSFIYPFIFDEECDTSSLLLEISSYARREMIPLELTDVPRECLGEITSVFRHVDAECYPSDEDSFFVRVNNECDLCEGVPSYECGELCFNEITEDDITEYEALLLDRELNKYWGYDPTADSYSSGEDFLRIARGEFNTGVAITLAVRENGAFIGELTLYDFDYLGGCEFALRLKREKQGQGIGKRCIAMVFDLCRTLGLKRVRGTVMKENTASCALVSKYMKKVGEDSDRVYYEMIL